MYVFFIYVYDYQVTEAFETDHHRAGMTGMSPLWEEKRVSDPR